MEETTWVDIASVVSRLAMSILASLQEKKERCLFFKLVSILNFCDSHRNYFTYIINVGI